MFRASARIAAHPAKVAKVGDGAWKARILGTAQSWPSRSFAYSRKVNRRTTGVGRAGMPRPKGWKPLNYRAIATICGKLCLRQGRHQVAREMGVAKETVGHLRRALFEAGALPRDSTQKIPAQEFLGKPCGHIR